MDPAEGGDGIQRGSKGTIWSSVGLGLGPGLGFEVLWCRHGTDPPPLPIDCYTIDSYLSYGVSEFGKVTTPDLPVAEMAPRIMKEVIARGPVVCRCTNSAACPLRVLRDCM